MRFSLSALERLPIKYRKRFWKSSSPYRRFAIVVKSDSCSRSCDPLSKSFSIDITSLMQQRLRNATKVYTNIDKLILWLPAKILKPRLMSAPYSCSISQRNRQILHWSHCTVSHCCGIPLDARQTKCNLIKSGLFISQESSLIWCGMGEVPSSVFASCGSISCLKWIDLIPPSCKSCPSDNCKWHISPLIGYENPEKVVLLAGRRYATLLWTSDKINSDDYTGDIGTIYLTTFGLVLYCIFGGKIMYFLLFYFLFNCRGILNVFIW